jgi:hypothetical protein
LADSVSFARTQDLWTDYITQYDSSRRAVAEARTVPLTIDDWRRRATNSSSAQQKTLFGEE